MAENNLHWKEIFNKTGKTLTCGQPLNEHLAALESLEANPILLGVPIGNKTMALCCVGALWLKADYFDRSHRIFQDVHTPTGSLWHGISHRREGDFGNAGYWFSRCGSHPAASFIAQKLVESTIEGYPPRLIQNGVWDFKILNWLAESDNNKANPGSLALRLQDLEWKSLFLWTLEQATGK